MLDESPGIDTIKKDIVLRDYQQVAKNFILNNPYAALHLPMAFGKTLTVLSALQDLPLQGHVLVVAPLNIAKLVWTDEIREWNFKLNHESLILNDKGKPLRDKMKRYAKYESVLTSPSKMYFINNELVEDLVYWMMDNSTYWPFPNVVIDESQSFKNPTSARFLALAKMRPDIQRIIELSGTPIPNGYLDLWSQMYLLDQGLSLGPNISWYKETFFKVTKMRHNAPIKWEPLPYAETEIQRRTSHLIISVENDKLVLPEKLGADKPIKIYLDDDLMERYKAFRNDHVLEFAESLESNGIVGQVIDDIRSNKDISEAERERQIRDMLSHAVIESAGTLRNKSLQFASGQVYTDDADRTKFEIVHDEKLKAIAAIVDQADSPVMIAYYFRFEMYRMLAELPKLTGHPVAKFDGSKKMQDDWNARKLPILIMHPKSAGHGLNLQHGGHNTIWWTVPDSSEQFNQLNARQARPGQKSSHVNIYIPTVMGTEDANQLPRIRNKDSVEREFMGAYKQDVMSAITNMRVKGMMTEMQL